MIETIHGVIDGNTIRLDHASALPAGTSVRVVITQEAGAAHEDAPPGEGLKRAFGAWADYANELDQLERETRELRRLERREQFE